jgi:hypothetical protein
VVVALTRSSDHAPAHQAARQRTTASLPGSIDIDRYQRFAGLVHSAGDFCGPTGPTGVPHFTLPASASAYHATLTVSFQYRAHGNGRTFTVWPAIASLGPPRLADSLPKSRPVLSTGGALSTATVVVRASGLSGGADYLLSVHPEMSIGCHIDPRTGTLVNAGISVTRVVYSLHAWRR